MSIHIAFQGGTHGHFLRFVLDKFSGHTPPILDLPFTPNGTSHKEINYSGYFKITHPHLWGWGDPNDPHIVITVEESDILMLQRLCYSRPGDRKIDIEKDIIYLPDDLSDRDSIGKLYGVNANDGIPKFILRDHNKLGFSDIQQHGYITADKLLRQKALNSVYYFPVRAFWDGKMFIEHLDTLGSKFKLDLNLGLEIVDLHEKFINLLPELKTKNRAAYVIDAIENGRNIKTDELDLIEQAFVYSWIETKYDNILAPFTNKFFSNTAEIMDYIKWYPHFYHGVNPTLPKI